MGNNILYYVGIDVQVKRGCSFFIVDKNAGAIDSGWIDGSSHIATAKYLYKIAQDLTVDRKEIAIGIDAPRMPLKDKRAFYWDGKKGLWRKRRKKEKGHGRHCEVIIKSLKIANPQWTRLEYECEDWMQCGFEIYNQFSEYRHVYEAFPSASYNMLKEDRNVSVTINFSNFSQGPKDMVDACIAAMTVYEFIHGRGTEVGDGDGLGSIILPRPLTDVINPELLYWPS